MKKLITLTIIILSFGCEQLRCDCDYVVYDKDPITNYVWKETYRSSWDTTCVDEHLDESTYTDSDGDKWYSKTEIECR